MSNFQDINQDLAKQYSSGKNLNARIYLHQNYSTNPQSWFEWLFQFYDVPTNGKLLELGCGTGLFWIENRETIPADWDITLTDFSDGMVEDAQENLGDLATRFHFKQANILDIPFPDNTFDVVAANHMLYHVDDLDQAFTEVKRVLKPEGLFIASTNSGQHLRDIAQLLLKVFPDQKDEIDSSFGRDLLGFRLPNGANLLEPHFKQVTLHAYEDGFRVTEAEPLVNYIDSFSNHEVFDAVTEQLHTYLQTQIDETGAVLIRKSIGVFVCRP